MANNFIVKQEDLNDAAYEYFENNKYVDSTGWDWNCDAIEAFKAGATWMYKQINSETK